MGEPKTREEILEERLREVNARLTIVKKRLGSDTESFNDTLQRAEKRKLAAKGDGRYVKVGGSMILGTDKLDALLAIEECYEGLLDLKGRNPVKEAETLISKKIKILKELIEIT